MSSVSEKKQQLVRELAAIGAVKFGSFKLKSGLLSPFYLDLRVCISKPSLVKLIGALMWQEVHEERDSFELICGVPYTGLPIATSMSLDTDVPMVMKRKEAKDYGTKKMVEGIFAAGQRCLMVEDIITSGMSVLETVASLKEEGLVCDRVVVLIDRQQGGRAILERAGVRVHSVLDIESVLQVLIAADSISADMVQAVRSFVADNQIKSVTLPTVSSAAAAPVPASLQCSRSFADRVASCENPVGKHLLNLMHTKQTNLCLSADVTTSTELLRLAELLGDEICLLKTHADIVSDFSADTASKLVALAEKHNFLIFEDRKFADIGNTASNQYRGGVYQIAEWAHITNCHIVPGPGVIEGLKKVVLERCKEGGKLDRALLLLAQMSSAGNMCTEAYTKETVELAKKHKDFVIGFISTSKLTEDEGFIHCTPGVNLTVADDSLGQQYKTPDHIIGTLGSDMIIVGRGIIQAEDPLRSAQQYRKAGWAALKKRHT